jgi:hypothetical protein
LLLHHDQCAKQVKTVPLYAMVRFVLIAIRKYMLPLQGKMKLPLEIKAISCGAAATQHKAASKGAP